MHRIPLNASGPSPARSTPAHLQCASSPSQIAHPDGFSARTRADGPHRAQGHAAAPLPGLHVNDASPAPPPAAPRPHAASPAPSTYTAPSQTGDPPNTKHGAFQLAGCGCTATSLWAAEIGLRARSRSHRARARAGHMLFLSLSGLDTQRDVSRAARSQVNIALARVRRFLFVCGAVRTPDRQTGSAIAGVTSVHFAPQPDSRIRTRLCELEASAARRTQKEACLLRANGRALRTASPIAITGPASC